MSIQPSLPVDPSLESEIDTIGRDEAIERLVTTSRETRSTTVFLRALVDACARSTGALHACLEAHDGPRLIEESTTRGGTTASFWEPTTRGALAETIADHRILASLFRAREGGMHLALVAVPFSARSGALSGAIALVVPCDESDAAAELVDRVSSLVALGATLADSLGTRTGDSAAAGPGAETVQALRRAASFSSVTELAFAVTNKLKTREGYDKVALARVRGTAVELASISGVDEIKAQSPGVRALRAAMEECLDLGRAVIHQGGVLPVADGDELARQAPLHRAWSDASAGAAVASIPVAPEGEVVAILSIRLDLDRTFEADEIAEVERLVTPYVATLDVVEQAQRTLIQHARESTSRAVEAVFSTRAIGRKVLAAAVAALAFWSVTGTVTHRVRAPATIVPAEQHHVGAPFDAVLREVRITPGDRVRAGDLLAVLDTRELELERARLTSELELQALATRRALAEGDAAAVTVARAEERRIRASLDLVEVRTERASVRATVDGTVLTGDLRDRVGDSVTAGEPLFLIGTSDDWRLELRVDERDVITLDRGMSGAFASLSRPEDRHVFEIERIRPAADRIDGENRFIVEASAQLDASWMRAGMEGFATVDAGRRSPLSAVFSDLVDAVRVRMWL